MKSLLMGGAALVGMVVVVACGGGSGSGGSGGEGGSGGQMCTGDAAVWNAIEKDTLGSTTIACTQNADCCFVANSCVCDFVVVAAKDFQSAKDNWPSCATECAPDCIYQGVKLECVNGTCQTTEGGDPALGFDVNSHCGP